MASKTDKTSTYTFQIIIGAILIALFFIRGNSYSLINIMKLTIGFVLIGLGIFGFIRSRKRNN
jgi:hypothetical protein